MLTLVHQRGSSRMTLHSPFGVIGLEPEAQAQWVAAGLVKGQTTLLELVETLREIVTSTQTEHSELDGRGLQ